MAKLLFITQKVDRQDDLLGIYHRWIEELAGRFDKISVICLYQGRNELPQNVYVYSLGKEKYHDADVRINADQRIADSKNQQSASSASNPRHPHHIKSRFLYRLIYIWRFYRYLWLLRHDYNTVFVHMNPEYVILGGLLWKLWNKKIILWYAHYLANLKLRVAAFFPDLIVTSTRLAYPLKSKKLLVLQQGIDTSRFRPANPKSQIPNPKFRILFLGRIAPVKHIEVLLQALATLENSGRQPITLTVVGEPTAGKPDEFEYYESLKKLTEELDLTYLVEWRPRVPNYATPEIFNGHDLFVNLTDTGSFDKSTLEAMACGLPVVVSNKAFKEIFPPPLVNQLLFEEKNYQDLAKKILEFLKLSKNDQVLIAKKMRTIIMEQHNLINLMDKLTQLIIKIKS